MTRSNKNHLFQIGHLLVNLRDKSVHGTLITIIAQSCKFFLNIGSTMILARILTPADFGLIAMVTIITGFVEMFKDAGLSMATIQRENITHEQVSALFWINLCISFLMMILIAALAPVIAWYFGEPRLMTITLIMAGTFVFSGLAIQHQAILTRQMHFNILAITDILANAAGITVAIIMAILTRSYWALVAMPATTVFINTATVWIFTGWIPSKPKFSAEVIPMLKFGGNLTSFNVLCYLVANADNFLIGRYWGAGPLGLYSKAYNLMTLPLRQLQQPISSIAVTSLSRLQSDRERFRNYYRKAMEASVILSMPLTAFSSVTADLIVNVILGTAWKDAAIIFIALSPAAFIDTFAHATGWALVPTGQVKRQLSWQIIGTPIMLTAFAIGIYWGPLGVAIAYTLTRCALRFPGLWFAFRKLPMKLSDVLINAIWRPSVASITAAIIILLTRWIIHLEVRAFFALSIYATIFAVLYFIIIWSLPSGRESVKDLFNLVIRRRDYLGSIAS